MFKTYTRIVYLCISQYLLYSLYQRQNERSIIIYLWFIYLKLITPPHRYLYNSNMHNDQTKIHRI